MVNNQLWLLIMSLCESHLCFFVYSLWSEEVVKHWRHVWWSHSKWTFNLWLKDFKHLVVFGFDFNHLMWWLWFQLDYFTVFHTDHLFTALFNLFNCVLFVSSFIYLFIFCLCSGLLLFWNQLLGSTLYIYCFVYVY